MAVVRWIFHDPYTDPVETWTVPINPNTMTSPFRDKNVSTQVTTAVNGKTLLFEGNAAPAQWQFGGVILDHDHYQELLRWINKRNRIQITDHFGRQMWAYLLSYKPDPRRALGRYWKHDYTIDAIVLSAPTAPTVTS